MLSLASLPTIYLHAHATDMRKRFGNTPEIIDAAEGIADAA